MHRITIGAMFMALLLLLASLASVSCQRSTPEEQTPSKTDVREKPSMEVAALRDASATSALQAIIQRGELRVGMQVGYVPFQMHGHDGNLVGLDVDLAEMAARSLNVVLRVVRLTWQELIPSLLEGKTDVVMSGMTVTPERNVQVLFTLPVLETGRMFLVHASNAEQFRTWKTWTSRAYSLFQHRAAWEKSVLESFCPKRRTVNFQTESAPSVRFWNGGPRPL